ncbi:MFS transporter [Vallicoccus soli]|uniref:MFS transporter n=1 Tax=Vallicoccus soli TaxID=2339232 RepID=A0A3A3Z4D8_9ACTN|nr:MFS transporter [Vallicoccus soli]RJK96476.1 MFS transporter [Vallicoccus soli]
MSPPTAEAAGVAAVQRRTVRVLAASQVLGGVGVASGIAANGLLAEEVSGSAGLSGLATTGTVLGAALAAVPLARLTAASGRRAGLAAGWLVGGAGAVVLLVAAAVDGFALLLLGCVLFGAASAANLQARYAATDLADDRTRGRALGLVVWATTVGAVLGPNLAGPGEAVAGRLGLPGLAGPVVFSVASFAAGAAVVGALLRPDPLVLARRVAGAPAGPGPRPRLGASLAVVRASPAATLALAGVAVAHLVMVAVMAMTPVHMASDGHGASIEVVGLVISGHIAGMYAFSPLVGWLVDRSGAPRVLLLGMLVLLAATAVAAAGSGGGAGRGAHAGAWAPLGLGLLLLGLGWSCALVAGSALLAASVPVPERPGVQGAADLVMNLAGAVGGAGAGALLGLVGYPGLNAVAALAVLPVLALGLTGVSRRRSNTRSG